MPPRAGGRRAHRFRPPEPEDPYGRRAHVLERSAAPAADPTGSLQVLSGGRGLHRRRAPYVRADGETPLRGRARGRDPREREAPERDALRRPRLRGDRARAEVRVHQFHPTLAPGDAMSNHVFALRKKIRHWGYESFAYAVEAKPGVADVRSYRRLFRDVKTEDLLIVHFSMGSEVVDQLIKIPSRRVLVYHNITPPEFFSGINPHAAAFARLGLRQLSRIAPAFELGIGVSEFNRRALVKAGYGETPRVPILLDWEHFALPPNDAVLARWKGLRTVLLFVGRISPNKSQHDLVRMLAYYRHCIDPEAQLILVGAYRDQPQFHARVVALIERLGLGGAVHFAGTVDDASLLACYRAATAFVSLSEHEGFGVPLLEAMRFRLPVVAYDAAAVGETVGNAGVLLRERDLAETAEAAAMVSEPSDLREALVAAGERRGEGSRPEEGGGRAGGGPGGLAGLGAG